MLLIVRGSHVGIPRIFISVSSPLWPPRRALRASVAAAGPEDATGRSPGHLVGFLGYNAQKRTRWRLHRKKQPAIDAFGSRLRFRVAALPRGPP